ncbi:MAG: DUF2442 domain-containing protein [Chromatiales bacterium]
MERVLRARALSDYRIDIEFDDGVRGIVSIKERLFGPMFEPLRDEKLFSQLKIDDFGVICWPNGADLAPDALYARLRAFEC